MHPYLNESLEVKTMKLGLDRMEIFDRVLGFPSRSFPSVHIAGTNGKGSVATKIAYLFQTLGKKVGLFTSPHLVSYRERIQISGQSINEPDADTHLRKIIETLSMNLSTDSFSTRFPQIAETDCRVLEAGNILCNIAEERSVKYARKRMKDRKKEAVDKFIRPSYFELLALLAFSYFAEKKVDLAVVEVGLGGRFDATNIVTPLVSVITSIDIDHAQYLGHTMEAIAFEKGGIIKPKVPIVLGPEAKPLHLFEKIAATNKSPLFQVEGMFAHYEEENRAITRKAVSLLPFSLKESAIEKGLDATPPCRFELVLDLEVNIILDVAHNPAAFQRTFERIAFTFGRKPVRVLASFSEGKDINYSLEILTQLAAQVHLTQADHPRAFTIENFSSNLPCLIDTDLTRAFETAYKKAAQHNQLLLVCGTFFMMEAVREELRKRGYDKSRKISWVNEID